MGDLEDRASWRGDGLRRSREECLACFLDGDSRLMSLVLGLGLLFLLDLFRLEMVKEGLRLRCRLAAEGDALLI